MEIRIQAIHFDATDKLQDFTQKKLEKLEKFSDNIIDADVTFKVTKPEVANNKEVSIKLNVKSGEFFANKTADTFEEAVDQVVEALEKQILKFKEKLNSK